MHNYVRFGMIYRHDIQQGTYVHKKNWLCAFLVGSGVGKPLRVPSLSTNTGAPLNEIQQLLAYYAEEGIVQRVKFFGAALYCFYFHRKSLERSLDIYMSTTWQTRSRYVIFWLYFGEIHSFAPDFISEESFRLEKFFEVLF